MKIDLRKYEYQKHYSFEEDVDFSNHVFSDNYRIRKIESCHVKVDLEIYEFMVNISLVLSGKVIGACSYTNEDVEISYRTKENMTFGESEDSGADYLYDNDMIDLDPYILSLIDNAVPQNIIKKGASLPPSNNDYIVISEEDYYKSKAKSQDKRWADLDKIDFDD